jgi:hypothetical protein
MYGITKTTLFCYVSVIFLIFSPVLPAAEHAAGGLVGYGQGPGFMLNTTVSDFAKGFPLDVRFGLTYTSLDPGDALAARRVFINDATNGTPEEDGRTWDLRCDLLYDLELFVNSRTFLVLGPRYSRFKGSFHYVGGNEQFDVTSRQWGIGAGMEGHYRLNSRRRLDLVVSAMLDYYFPAGLSGHDTTYNPHGSDVNPRGGYDWDDADAAINQPELVPRLMVGINYIFGS